jgi:hypothetical protein
MKYPAFIALGLLCLGEAAPAQFGTGQSGSSTTVPLGNVQAYRELQLFGSCYARNQRKAALALIATVPGSTEEAKSFRKLLYGEQVICLSGGSRMSMPVVFARGAIAEGLLRTEGVPDTYRLPSPSPADVRDLHGTARCYTSGHRGEVQKLLQTEPGSAEEAKAVRGLWNDFRACMPGATVRLNAPWIRYLLAEALLRLGPNTTASGV